MFVGIDLAWRAKARTGLAAVDRDGRLVASTSVVTDDEIGAWVRRHEPTVVAIDAPLVVPNETGQRVGERELARAYGRYGAGPYPSNRANPLFDPPRAEILARRLGWNVDPESSDAVTCIEVYPHPALVGLFSLPKRILYKKGPDRRPGFELLMRCLASVPELVLEQSPRWAELMTIVAAPGPGDLNRIEDELDAILCAHLAWLWRNRPGALQIYGSLEEGYIVAPPPPSEDVPTRRSRGGTAGARPMRACSRGGLTSRLTRSRRTVGPALLGS